jgi:hypothetical protein
MADYPLKASRDLERAIHVWETGRDIVQQLLNEASLRCNKQVVNFEAAPIVVNSRSYIADCNANILAAKVRIDELERGD